MQQRVHQKQSAQGVTVNEVNLVCREVLIDIRDEFGLQKAQEVGCATRVRPVGDHQSRGEIMITSVALLVDDIRHADHDHRRHE